MENMHILHDSFAPDQTVDADVTALSSDGRGIARIPGPDGRNIVCFITDALPEQRVRIRLTAVKPRLMEGVVETVLTPSPHERPAVCAHSDECGGCPWQRLAYAEQCRWKAQALADSLLRLAKVDVAALPTLQEQTPLPFRPSPQEWGFRNKMTFAFEQVGDTFLLGQRGRHSHSVVDITDCRLQDPLTMRVLAAVRAACTAHGPADWRHVVVRRPRGESGTQAALRVELIVGPRGRVRGEDLYHALQNAVPELTGFAVSLRQSESFVAQGEKTLFTAGDPDNLEILHRADGSELRLAYDDRSFLQVNTPATEQLYAEAARLLDLSGHERLWDLYCGVGSIGLYLAPQVEEVRGIESVPTAVTYARANAQTAGFKHCHFEVGDSTKEFARQARAVSHPTYGTKDTMKTVVVVDPPRIGLDKQLIGHLAKLKPEKICYISCNPATLARDAALLAPTHRLVAVSSVDLFPQTPHVEAVCLFLRNEQRNK